MSRTVLTLNNAQYRFAHKDLLPRGGRQFTIDSKPWQPGMPGQQEVALWNVDGPQLYSYEEIVEGQESGPLGVAYGDGVDTRWSDTMTLGPALTQITLTGFDTSFPVTALGVNSQLGVNTGLGANPVQGNVTRIEITQGTTSGEYYAYFVRNGYVTKVNLATLAVVADQSFTDAAVDAYATVTPSGVRELSVALNGSAYQVANPIGSNTSDTWTVNSQSSIQQRFGQDPLRVVGMANTTGQLTVQGNSLSSTVTMASPAWATVTNIIGALVAATGFVVDGYRWVIGTTRGPYYIDPQLGQPYQLLPEMENNTENRLLGWWSFLGVIIGHRYGSRWQKANIGRSFGIETFPENRTPVQGYPTGETSSLRWHYEAVYNATTNTTWLVAYHPDLRELRQGVVASPFVIGKFAGNAVSRALKWAGTANQARATQLLLGGLNTNGFYTIVGETPTEIDDTNYRFTASGTGYFTELRRFPHLLKDIEAIEFETVGCAAGRTIGVSLVVSGDSAQPATVTLAGTTAGVNDVISTNGYQRRLFVDNAGVPLTTATGRRFYPQLAFTTNAATQSPAVVGTLRIHYVLRPQMIDEITVYLQCQNSNVGTAWDQIQALQALQNSGAVLMQDDWWGASGYVRVYDVKVPPEALNQGGSTDRPADGEITLVTVVLHRWITGSNGLLPT